MGIIVLASLAGGCVIGLMATVALGSISVFIAVKRAEKRNNVWWYFTGAFVIAWILAILVLNNIPFDHIRPGNDYDLAIKKFFLQGLFYCASLGFSAFAATLITLLFPQGLKRNCQGQGISCR